MDPSALPDAAESLNGARRANRRRMAWTAAFMVAIAVGPFVPTLVRIQSERTPGLRSHSPLAQVSTFSLTEDDYLTAIVVAWPLLMAAALGLARDRRTARAAAFAFLGLTAVASLDLLTQW